MQSSKEQQGDIRKPSSAINAKKQRKATEWERLEISSRKLETSKGTFHAKMGSIKDRNFMDLTEAEDIKKRWKEYEYTEELYKKDLHDPDNHDGVITDLKPDILKSSGPQEASVHTGNQCPYPNQDILLYYEKYQH